MISDDEIKAGYLARYGKPMKAKDLAAFKWFTEAMDCEDLDSFEDGFARIAASIDMMCDE